jgi:alkanesulfonate monooxygenase SsuD/methylene tetrahydromethanopterin reductase-like flavin-dependent oxidoreductase (luciferase family)
LAPLLLAYYDPDGRLIYAERVGAGVNEAELERLWRRLQTFAAPGNVTGRVSPQRKGRLGAPLVLSRVISDKGVPVWFGGESNPALRRVAEYGDGWIGFNLLPDQAAEKIKRIEELLKANGRTRSDVKLAVSPYTNPIKTDDLKRYRDAGVEEIALLTLNRPRTERDMIAGLEQMARINRKIGKQEG